MKTLAILKSLASLSCLSGLALLVACGSSVDGGEPSQCGGTCSGETPLCNAATGACECTASPSSCTGAKVCDPATQQCTVAHVGPADAGAGDGSTSSPDAKTSDAPDAKTSDAPDARTSDAPDATCLPQCTGKCGGEDNGCGGQCAYCPSGEWCTETRCAAWTGMSIYVVPAVRDTKILPDSVLASDLAGYELSARASPGEYEPASFVVRAGAAIKGLAVEASPLTSSTGAVLPAASVDIRVVKVWWQATKEDLPGIDCYSMLPEGAMTPELLLKDDTLVTVEADKTNKLKLSGDSGSNYVLISERLARSGVLVHTVAEFPVRDATSLQPVDVPAGTNKQFWITVHVPEGAAAGTYKGTLGLRTADGVGTLGLTLEVLPVSLSKPLLTYSLFYRATLSNAYPDGSISSEYKSEAQLRAELTNMREHGVANPNVYQPYTGNLALLTQILTIRQELGMAKTPLYYLGQQTGNSHDSTELATLRQRVRNVLDTAAKYEFAEVFFFGRDEATGADITAQTDAWNAVHAEGGKVFASGGGDNIGLVGSIQDLHVSSSRDPSATEAAQWHNYGHRIFSYNNPQVVPEQPRRFRHNYGLLLWQRDFDGAMDYAYQHSYSSIWNDFDHAEPNSTHGCRDHVFAYPTVDGVIDTIQWEGFREGVDDVRYLSTLLDLLKQRRSEGRDVSEIDSWLAGIKQSSLVDADLDQVRADIVARILCLLDRGPCVF
jgi:hypothetical protein